MTALVRRAALASVLAISLCGVMVAVCGKVPSLGFGAAAQSSGAPQVSFVVSGLMGLDGGWIAVSDINDAGRATGSASQQGQQRAVIWNDGRIVDLGIPGAGTSRGVAVDAAGRVACLATDPVGEFVCRGLLCDPDGESVDLELRTSMADSRCDVCGMNNLGQVVGAIRLADGTWEPAVWDRGGGGCKLGRVAGPRQGHQRHGSGRRLRRLGPDGEGLRMGASGRRELCDDLGGASVRGRQPRRCDQ